MGESEGTVGGAVHPSQAPATRPERIVNALGDPVNRRLLGFLDAGPRSVQEILTRLGLPKSTVYSRLHDLRELGLVAVQRTVISPEGKRTDLFRSLLEEARIDLRAGSVTLTMRTRDLTTERLKSLWSDLRQEAGTK